MARAVEVAGRRGCSKGANAERERERERDEKVSRSSSQEQEQSSGPKHLSPSASPVAPYSFWPPSWPPTCMYSLADARTCQCDQFTLETLTKIKFQVHRPRRSLFHSEAYSTRIWHREKRTSGRERDRPNGYNGIENWYYFSRRWMLQVWIRKWNRGVWDLWCISLMDCRNEFWRCGSW